MTLPPEGGSRPDPTGGPMPRAHRVGWALFLVSAALFAWSGIRVGDPVVVAGSIAFGVASACFLLPARP